MATPPPDPYANITLDPAITDIATTIQGRMSQWIDARIDQLAVLLTARAEAVGMEITSQWQTNFESMNKQMTESTQKTLDQIAAIKLKFTDPALLSEVGKLEQAVVEHKQQMEKRREEFKQYGMVVGQVAKTALMTAAKL